MSAPATSPWTNSSTLSGQPVNPDRLYWDKLSGTSSREQRHRLAALLHYARPGDAIVVIGIDRLGRNAAEVMATIRELRDRDIVLRSPCGTASTLRTQQGAWLPSTPPTPPTPWRSFAKRGSRSHCLTRQLHPIARSLNTLSSNTSQQFPNSPNSTHYHSMSLAFPKQLRHIRLQLRHP